MPLSALMPDPDNTTIFLALDRISRKARMSLEGPLSLFVSDLDHRKAIRSGNGR